MFADLFLALRTPQYPSNWGIFGQISGPLESQLRMREQSAATAGRIKLIPRHCSAFNRTAETRKVKDEDFLLTEVRVHLTGHRIGEEGEDVGQLRDGRSELGCLIAWDFFTVPPQ